MFGLSIGASNPSSDSDRTLSLLETLVSETRRSYPEIPFDIKPTGDILMPNTAATAWPRVASYLRHEVRAIVGHAHLHVMTNTKFQSEIGKRVDQESSQTDLRLQNQQMVEILKTAIASGASDTYIDIGPYGTFISYRINGIKNPPQDPLTTEQGFDIARALWAKGSETFQERAACDMSFTYDDMRFRGNSLPTFNNGAGVVLRMRDPTFHLPLDNCGYSNRQIEAIKAVCQSPGGLILLTGETNSGKSSTMATLMNMLPLTTKTVEISDPVEVEFQHITQVMIQRHAEDAEDRFKAVLAGLVRQNPDTLVLGEIRDKETTDAAMQMALQGKRVISTLHTQSCILAFARLGDLGMDPTLIYKAGFIAGVVNQNLVPMLCKECRTPEPPTLALREEIGDRHEHLFDGKARYASGINCGDENCRNGIIAQTLVAEVFPMSFDRDGEVIEKLANNRAKEALSTIGDDWGMESKHQHAYAKIMSGECDPCQVEAIIGRFTKSRDSVYPQAREM